MTHREFYPQIVDYCIKHIGDFYTAYRENTDTVDVENDVRDVMNCDNVKPDWYYFIACEYYIFDSICAFIKDMDDVQDFSGAYSDAIADVLFPLFREYVIDYYNHCIA